MQGRVKKFLKALIINRNIKHDRKKEGELILQSTWKSWFPDSCFFSKRRQEKARRKLTLDIKTRAFLSEFCCSTPIGPVPVVNCLTSCELSPIPIVNTSQPYCKKTAPNYFVFPSQEESTPFIHNWDIIQKEIANENVGYYGFTKL